MTQFLKAPVFALMNATEAFYHSCIWKIIYAKDFNIIIKDWEKI